LVSESSPISANAHEDGGDGPGHVYVALTPGQQHDSTMAEELLPHAQGRAFIADTAYDADRIIAAVRAPC
jgi:hypothetical protein